MENPNTYEDEAFTAAADEATDAIQEMWQAGGEPDDIAAVIKDALEGARANDAKGVTVTIEAQP